MYLLDFGRAQYDRADILILRCPSNRKLGTVPTHFLGDGGKLLDFLDLGLSSGTLQFLDSILEDGLVGGEARIFRNPIVVFPCKQSRRQWRPDSGAILEFLEKWGVLDLEALAIECVVLRLLGDGSDEVVGICDFGGLGNLGCRPF